MKWLTFLQFESGYRELIKVSWLIWNSWLIVITTKLLQQTKNFINTYSLLCPENCGKKQSECVRNNLWVDIITDIIPQTASSSSGNHFRLAQCTYIESIEVSNWWFNFVNIDYMWTICLRTCRHRWKVQSLYTQITNRTSEREVSWRQKRIRWNHIKVTLVSFDWQEEEVVTLNWAHSVEQKLMSQNLTIK